MTCCRARAKSWSSSFWETAFEQLKQRKAIYFETEGKNKGCWVMPASAFKDQTNEDTEDSKVIVRSNNTVTYVGKDIAYQLWKFGLLGKDFITARGSNTTGMPSMSRPPTRNRLALRSSGMANWFTT